MNQYSSLRKLCDALKAFACTQCWICMLSVPSGNEDGGWAGAVLACSICQRGLRISFSGGLSVYTCVRVYVCACAWHDRVKHGWRLPRALNKKIIDVTRRGRCGGLFDRSWSVHLYSTYTWTFLQKCLNRVHFSQVERGGGGDITNNLWEDSQPGRLSKMLHQT